MTAMYRVVKADILDKITQGVWAPGSQMPNEMRLAETYDCARATVNRAMRELAEEGIIERRRKSGTRVRMNPVRQARFGIPLVRKEIEDQLAVYGYTLINSTIEPAPDWLRGRLGLAVGGLVRHVCCMHTADDMPFQLEDRWISLDALPDAETVDFSQSGPNEWLVTAVPFSNAEMSLLAVQADAKLATLLHCAKGDALFQTERSTWMDGQAITYVRLIFRGGHKMTTQY